MPPGPGEQPYGETVNGGGYAQVIREAAPAAPARPSRAASAPRLSGPQRQQPGQGDAGPGQRPHGNLPPPAEPSRRPDQLPASGAPVAGHHDPVPAGGRGELAVTGPGAVYGPEDPAYGPPSPEWYTRDERDGQQAAAEELAHARGPFEPPEHQGGSGGELVSYQPVGYESPGGAGQDRAGGGTTPLDQLKDCYAAAEAVGPGDPGGHLEQLLERQRQLISEYFTQAAGQEGPR